MKNTILILTFLFLSLMISAQKAMIDSLKTVIKTTKTDTIKIKALNKLTEMVWQDDKYRTALKYAELSKNLSIAISYSPGAVRALNNIGLINMSQGNHPLALENFLQARRINLEMNQPEQTAQTLNNIGALFWNKREPEKALDYFSQSLEIYRSIGDSAGLSNNYNNIGILYSESGKYEKALEFYFKALSIIERSGSKHDLANTLNNICNVYWNQNNTDEALNYQYKALEIRRSLDDKDGIAISLVNLGGIYLDKKQYPKAIDFLKQGIHQGNAIGNPAIVRESEKLLVTAYEETRDSVKAYRHFKRFIAYRDSIYNEEKTKDIVRSEMNFEFEIKQQAGKMEQEKKELLSAEELKRQKLTTYVFAGSSILVLLLALAILRGYNQKRKANSMLQEQKKIIEEKNKDITDSINYARQIQHAILPFEERFSTAFGNNNYFILFKPRDIVSGDFYWFAEKENTVFLAVVDCTGHGVPGAFMSMVGSAALSNIVNEKNISEPDKILSQLDKDIRKALNQEAGGNRDGMDMALCVIDKSENKLHFSGAMNSLYYYADGELKELKGNKSPIGGLVQESERIFTSHTININSPVSFYLTTDGFPDQFGGETAKKFKTANLKKLLASVQNKTMSEQKEIIDTAFEKWKGNLEQVDDVCIIGVRL